MKKFLFENILSIFFGLIALILTALVLSLAIAELRLHFN
jgi:hypothetical protein